MPVAEAIHTSQTTQPISRLRRYGALLEAESACKQQVSQYPNDYVSLFEYGLISLILGDVQKCQALVGQGIRCCDQPAVAAKYTGLMLFSLERYADSYAHLNQAVGQGMSDEETLPALMFAHWYRNDRKQASEQLLRFAQDYPHVADGWICLSLMYKILGKAKQSIQSCERALSILPDRTDWLNMLGDLYADCKKSEMAVETYLKAINRVPAHPIYIVGVVRELNKLGRYQDSEHILKRALNINPNLMVAMDLLGQTYMTSQQYAKARHVLLHALVQYPTVSESNYKLGVCCMYLGRFEEARRWFNTTLTLQPGHTSALGYYAHCLRELRQTEEADYIEDMERLIFADTVDRFDGQSDIPAYKQQLREVIQHHPTNKWEHEGYSTRHGVHSGNLLQQPTPEIAPLEQAIHAKIRAYIEAMRAEMPQEHPFLRAIPEHYTLSMWAVILDEGGYQEAHNHSEGWISGCYYLSVPGEVASQSSDNHQQGWIEFGEPGYGIPHSFKPPLKSVRPEEDKIVLFPSYMFHRTIPFESSETRISIAFDVIPMH